MKRFLGLPSVKTVCMTNFLLISSTSLTHLVGPWNIENLTFHGGPIHDILIFLPQFTCLRKFHYDYGTRKFHAFKPRKVTEGLTHLQSCLEDLTLLHNRKLPFSRGYGGTGSLRGFTSLKAIAINCDALLGQVPTGYYAINPSLVTQLDLVELLPKSLHKLTLANCEIATLGHLWTLLRRKSSLVPNLNHIALVFWSADSEKFTEIGKAIYGGDTPFTTACANEGLSLRVHFTDWHGGERLDLELCKGWLGT